MADSPFRPTPVPCVAPESVGHSATDIIDQLAWFVTNEVRMPAGLIVTVIDEIQRLRHSGSPTPDASVAPEPVARRLRRLAMAGGLPESVDELLLEAASEVERLGDRTFKDAAEIGRLLAELALLRRQLAATSAERDLWQRDSHT